jgi:hypothetical protein
MNSQRHLTIFIPYADGALSSSIIGLTQKIIALKESVEYKPKQHVNNREKRRKIRED